MVGDSNTMAEFINSNTKMEKSSTSDFQHWKTLEEFEMDDTGKEFFKYYLESKNKEPVFECITYRYVYTYVVH